MLQYELPDGSVPAILAAQHLAPRDEQLLHAINNARFVTARIASVIPGRGVLLEVEEERLEVRSRAWARLLQPQGVVMTHLLPVRAGVWVPGPGWLVWPIELGPNIRREMSVLQITPIEVERILQGKRRVPQDQVEHTEELSLTDAVARMTEAAQQAGRNALILSVEAWEHLVQQQLDNADTTVFFKDVLDRAGPMDEHELQEWLERARAIWNATPQPDRGGKTAYELSREPPG